MEEREKVKEEKVEVEEREKEREEKGGRESFVREIIVLHVQQTSWALQITHRLNAFK